MKKSSSKSGFALAFSLIMLLLAVLILGALFTVVSTTSRLSAVYEGVDRCRLAAQSAIEIIKPEIDTMFQKSTGNTTVRIGPRSSTAFSWFNLPSGGKTIGTGKYTYSLPASNIVLNGCSVRLAFGPSGQTATNSSSAIVSLIARARYQNANGTISESVIEERFRFGTGRSHVFDYAYFVNNYGWFQGSGCTANGDVRANGNMYLDSSCKVNGEVYAAQNEELNVVGSINSTGKMDSRSTYWSSSKTSTQSRPTSPTYNGGSAWAGGYEAPTTVTSTDLQNRLHANEETGIAMPWIGDLDQYVEYAQDEGGTLSGGLRYSITTDGNVSSTQNTTINAHYTDAGPSGDATLADNGAIVLEGTKSNPIKVNGPVVFDNDVVIKGYVTGQGTIYSGRNIHVVGNIQYVNAPSWSHPDSTPETTAQANASKDLVGFAAKGNIVLGNSSQTSIFTSDIKTYLTQQPYVQQYACDASDSDIGYPRAGESKFCGNYTATDGGSMVTVNTKTEYITTQVPYTNRRGETKYQSQTQKIVTKYFSDSATRHYYDSVVPSALISTLYSNNGNGFLITKIDGVLYNNHGIFGKIGACTINGALVCRNEGILYSNYLNINHDIRLREDSAEGLSNSVGMPVGASSPGVVSWHELPVSVNYARFD